MAELRQLRTGLKFHPIARAANWIGKPIKIRGKGVILVVCAGTSDIPVAEEAVLTASMMGNRVEKLFDVGVAGIHRLLENRLRLDAASVHRAARSYFLVMEEEYRAGVPTLGQGD